jgi:hypothetical protein
MSFTCRAISLESFGYSRIKRKIDPTEEGNGTETVLDLAELSNPAA